MWLTVVTVTTVWVASASSSPPPAPLQPLHHQPYNHQPVDQLNHYQSPDHEPLPHEPFHHQPLDRHPHKQPLHHQPLDHQPIQHHLQHQPLPRSLPCPEANDILPCTCRALEDLSMRMDCSEVKSNQQLVDCFAAPFPYFNFFELIIKQDPNNPDYDLNALHPDVFGLATFEEVIITGTKIDTIDTNVFSKSHNYLRYLDLSNNQLSNFQVFETVPDYIYLETLILNNNKLPKLQNLVSTSLKVFSINSNPFLTFEGTVYDLAPSLERISMSNIDLTETQLDQTIFHNLPNITLIDLGKNLMNTMDEWSIDSPRNTIKYLIIEDNQLVTLHTNATKGLAQDAMLTYSGNEIFELDQSVWQPIFDQVPNGVIDLSDNPLRCGCDMAWIQLDDANRYLPLLTESTNCHDGTQVITLDQNYFLAQCK